MRGAISTLQRTGPAIALAIWVLACGTPAAAAERVVCAEDGSILSVTVPGGGAVSLSSTGNAVLVTDVVGIACEVPLAELAAIVVTSSGAAAAVSVFLPVDDLPPISFALRGSGTLALAGTPASDVVSFGTSFGGGATIVRTTIEAGAGDDRIDATAWDGSLVVAGGDGADRLIGGDADDALDGGPGDDTLDGGPGADRLDGGTGNDRADYSRSSEGVRVTLGASSGNVGGTAAGDVVAGVEDLIGSPGDDLLRGDAGRNVLLGGGGDDVLEGRGGADLLSGGFGSDTASYASSPGPVVATIGAQTGNAGGDAEGDVLVGLEGLVGSRSGDVLTGDDARNRLVGGGGDDVLDGTGGADTLLGGPGDDLLIGGTGRDTASYAGSPLGISVDLTRGLAAGQGRDELFEIESAVGSRSADLLVGSGGANRLVGGPGPDVLRGRGGPDVLDGGPDGDLLDGGPGQDRCDPGTGDDRLLAC